MDILRQNNKGQANVIILLFVVVALIVYAVTLNLGRITETKMLTQIASESGASMLASEMASYGQNLLMTQLGGVYKKCKSTGLIQKIVTLIILIVITIICWGTCAGFTGGAAAALFAVGFVAAGISIVLQFTTVQPLITAMWNKITSQTLGIEDQFIETGIQSGIRAINQDLVLVPDLIDLDTDGIYGYDVNGQPRDYVSRYPFYYQFVRLANVQVTVIPEIPNFMAGLLNFIYQTPPDDPDCPTPCSTDPNNPEECVVGPDPTLSDGFCAPVWALFDPLPVPGQLGPGPGDSRFRVVPITEDPAHICHPANITEGGALEPSLPSECNSCCFPLTIPNPDTTGPNTPITIRPFCCDHPDPLINCGTATTCAERSPYGQTNSALGIDSSYAFVYDPFYENHENTFLSFRETIGRDDENRYYSKNPSNPNGMQQTVRPGAGNLDVVFTERDTTGYYAAYPPPSPDVPENRIGFYHFLYKIYDQSGAPENHWGFDLSTVDFTDPEFWKMPACKWCDARLAEASACDPNLPNDFNQLTLPVDPFNVSFIQTNTSPCVDAAIDKVSAPAGIGVPEDTCTLGSFDPSNPVDGFWKPGSDRFCNEGDNPSDGIFRWPYGDICPKYDGCFDTTGTIPAPCVCPESPLGPQAWPEDPMEDMVYETEEFIASAIALLGRADTQLSVGFNQWYDQWSFYIDPGESYSINGNPIPCYAQLEEDPPGSGTYVLQCKPDRGLIFVWRDTLAYMINRFTALRDSPYVGNTCSEVWCIPPTGCSDVTAEEESVFDINGNGIRGDMEDVIACMQFHSRGYDYAAGSIRPAGSGLGNDTIFQQCAQTCSPADCGTDPFPRSMVPGFDPNATPFVAPDPTFDADRLAFLGCLTNCSTATCDPAGGFLPAAGSGPAPGYSYPAVVFDAITSCPASNWATGDPWYDAMVANLDLASGPGSSCNMADGGWLRNIFLSWHEARNLVPKLELREQFLSRRFFELNIGIFILQNMLNNFDNFIFGSVVPLIQARINLDNQSLSNVHPFHMIYGWRDEPRPGQVRGAWHIVKVEARIPKRCGSGNCDGDEDGNPPFSTGDVPWPRVRTYTETDSDFGSARPRPTHKRCFELVNRSGGVKFRVTRVDEKYGEGQARMANGFTLWQFKKGAPSRDINPSEWEALGANCDPLPNPSTALTSDPIYGGAFLLNERTSDPNVRQCWDKATELLGLGGTYSDACAVYYGKDGDRRGFSFDFVPCVDDGGNPVF